MQFVHVPMPTEIPYISPRYVNGSRLYDTPDGNFPSITYALSKLPRLNSGIQQWIKKVGKEFASFESKRCLQRGLEFHSMVQLYLENKPSPSGFGVLPKSLFDNAKAAIDDINFIHGVELPLWSKALGVAGTCDCIANYKNTLSIIDFKSATRAKRKEWLKSYFLQETAYSLMYEERTGISINSLVTLVSAEDGEVQVFLESRDNFVDELHDCMREFRQKVVA